MIVPEKHLVRANGLNRIINGLVMIAGPPSGAFLMKAVSMQWVLSVDIITAAIAIGCLLPLAIPQPEHTTLSKKPNVIKDMAQGFRYVVSWRGLFVLFVLFSLMNFFAAPSNALMPLFVTKRLGGDVLRMGWLGTSVGIGIITGGLVLGAWGGFKKRIITCLVFVIIQACGVITLSQTGIDTYWLALAAIFICGCCQAFIGGPIHAIMQVVVARDMQGRVFSLLGSIAGAMMPISLAISGPLADKLGVRTLFMVEGMAVGLTALAGFTSKNLMNLENQKPEEQIEDKSVLKSTVPANE